MANLTELKAAVDETVLLVGQLRQDINAVNDKVTGLEDRLKAVETDPAVIDELVATLTKLKTP